MNELDFDRALIRQRNEEMVRQVRIVRLEKRLRTSREHRRAIWRTRFLQREATA